MIKLNKKAYADLKNGDWRVVLVKEDNSVLKILADGLEESTARRVANHWNEDKGFK